MSRVGLRVGAQVLVPEPLHPVAVEQARVVILGPAQKLVVFLVGDLREELGMACHREHEALCYDSREALISGLDCQACSLFCRVSMEMLEYG